ncbi:hypothetical protein K431DRAFT_286471 [Polychaeton citri CBS 116435]|uniref:SIMPL domain-containing protein n=1 Tax=Polychaeton citri CBS 116435 TaxID=1314669 RepID=A0A9P4UNC8_9PEZI|nr:hypothetical protein K431DRAFT_286471 [Polychaeton citri CBS 116435]
MASSVQATPLKLTVVGKSSFPHIAERACLTIVIADTGTDRAAVSSVVLETAANVDSLLEPLRQAPPESASGSGPSLAPISYSRKASLTTSWQDPYQADMDGPTPAREYSSRMEYDIRFRTFTAATLGKFTTALSTFPHAKLERIDWRLTPSTEKAHCSLLRREAAADAMLKARDYCSALGSGVNLRAVQVDDVESSNAPSWGVRGGGGRSYQTARMATPRNAGGEVGPEMEYQPKLIVMEMEVTIVFHADTAPLPELAAVPPTLSEERALHDDM